jgi:hypothetical protein
LHCWCWSKLCAPLPSSPAPPTWSKASQPEPSELLGGKGCISGGMLAPQWAGDGDTPVHRWQSNVQHANRGRYHYNAMIIGYRLW